MSRKSKENNKLISLLNDLLSWHDPERDKGPNIGLKAAVSEPAQTELGHKRPSDSI